MKKWVLFIILSILICPVASAEMRHTFYERYDPSKTGGFVYDSTGAETTGDDEDVFTYDFKTIFISCEEINSTEIAYQIEGRPVGELDTWSILDTGGIGANSSDNNKNFAIDVTELVDYIRVGLGHVTGDGSDRINVRGIFRRKN